MTPNNNESVQKSSKSSASFSDYREKLEEFLNEYLVKKAPALPENIKSALVNYGPYVVMVILVLGLFILIPLIFGSLLVASISAATGNSVGALGIIASLLFSLPALILEGIAIPGLLNKSKSKGWNYLLYAFILDSIFAILTLNLVWLLFRVLFLYGLFQIRDQYKD